MPSIPVVTQVPVPQSPSSQQKAAHFFPPSPTHVAPGTQKGPATSSHAAQTAVSAPGWQPQAPFQKSHPSPLAVSHGSLVTGLQVRTMRSAALTHEPFEGGGIGGVSQAGGPTEIGGGMHSIAQLAFAQSARAWSTIPPEAASSAQHCASRHGPQSGVAPMIIAPSPVHIAIPVDELTAFDELDALELELTELPPPADEAPAPVDPVSSSPPQANGPSAKTLAPTIATQRNEDFMHSP